MNSFSIRPYRPDDVDSLYHAASESINEVGEWLPWCSAGYSYADAEAWVSTRQADWDAQKAYSLVIVDSATGAFVGGTGLNNIDWRNRWANLGYWIRSSRTRQGAASTAVPLVARFGFEQLELQRCEIVAAIDNIASQRTAEKAGAAREGVLRNRLLLHDELHNAVVYSIIPEDHQTTARHPLTLSMQKSGGIVNDRYTVRPYRPTDARAHWEALIESIDDINPWLPWCTRDYSFEQALTFSRKITKSWHEGTAYSFAVLDRQTDKLVGNCEINHLNPLHASANIGYWIKSSSTGQGAASAAIRQVAAFAFDKLNLTRCEIVAATQNLGSQGAALRAGARYEASLRNRIWLHEVSHDAFVFSLIPSDLS